VAKGQTHKNLAFLFQRIGYEITLCEDLKRVFDVLVGIKLFKKNDGIIETVSRWLRTSESRSSF
jgi:hypothetical protein